MTFDSEESFLASTSENHPSLEGRDSIGPCRRFPQTRYLGSKRKLLPVLAESLRHLEFEHALDAFCGTASVAFLFKCLGKNVMANDSLVSNAIGARALLGHRKTAVLEQLPALCSGLPDPAPAPGFIETTFDNVFYERDENRFLDQLLPRIHALPLPDKDMALYSLFQACLAKRPYNLFHRANVKMRRADVTRSFGNKKTWDTPFFDLMARACEEAESAVFETDKRCVAACGDALEIDPSPFDLVYLDPPYVSAKGSAVDYLDYYHFLEGLAGPEGWSERILTRYKHKPLVGRGQNPWSDPSQIARQLRRAVDHFSGSLLVVSYRSDGIPSISEIETMLKRCKRRVWTLDTGRYTYALSRNRSSSEMLLFGV